MDEQEKQKDESVPKGHIFLGASKPHNRIDSVLPKDPPPWRAFTPQAKKERGSAYKSDLFEREMVNAALYLRRPLLVTGKPGSGKSSLAYAVAHELGLGDVLVWPITTRATLQQGLYNYDAIARLQDASLQSGRMGEKAVGAAPPAATAQDASPPSGSPKEQPAPGSGAAATPDIGRYIRLGPLGTALLGNVAAPAKSIRRGRPRVLLIDEIDKSDVDLPNDLLNVFEEGEFEILELSRLPEEESYRFVEVGTSDRRFKARIERGRVHCWVFPLVIMTSNGEREFPPAFLRRCLRLEVAQPNIDRLRDIVTERLKPGELYTQEIETLLGQFVDLRDVQKRELATDQLLNAVYMVMHEVDPLKRPALREALLRSLTEAGSSNPAS